MNLGLDKETRSYVDWGKSELETHRLKSTDIVDPNDYRQRCLVFLTVMFDQRAMSLHRQGPGKANCNAEMEAFRHLYQRICLQFDQELGVSGPRERPFAVYATDYEGAKHVSYQPARPHNVHIHAILAVKPDEVHAYLRLLNSLRLRMALASHRVQRIEAKPFDPQYSLDQSVSYVLKAWIKAQRHPSPWGDMKLIRGHDLKMPGVKRRLPSLRDRMRKRELTYASCSHYYDWELKQTKFEMALV